MSLLHSVTNVQDTAGTRENFGFAGLGCRGRWVPSLTGWQGDKLQDWWVGGVGGSRGELEQQQIDGVLVEIHLTDGPGI